MKICLSLQFVFFIAILTNVRVVAGLPLGPTVERRTGAGLSGFVMSGDVVVTPDTSWPPHIRPRAPNTPNYSLRPENRLHGQLYRDPHQGEGKSISGGAVLIIYFEAVQVQISSNLGSWSNTSR